MYNKCKIIRIAYIILTEHNLPEPFGPTTAVNDFKGPIISFPL